MNIAVVVAELVDTVIYASVAGVGVAVVFSIAIYGATRSADMARENRFTAAIALGFVALVAFLTCMVAAIGGLFIML